MVAATKSVSSPVRSATPSAWTRCDGPGRRTVRLVVQRVRSATVEVGGGTVGAIDRPGLVVLVGVTHTDDPTVAARVADKVWNLRMLAGERSCAQENAPLLVVSQFTLYAETRKGRRPSWNAAAPASSRSTSTSDTVPRMATTLRSSLAPGARVRSVQLPSPAKNRKCPVAEVGTSAVNSPPESSRRTYAPATGASPRSTRPWITASLVTLMPSTLRPPVVAPHIICLLRGRAPMGCWRAA